MVLPLSRAILMALLFLIFTPVSSAAEQPLVTMARLPVDMASELASFAMHSCAQRGADVSVSIVDSQGQLQVFLQGDEASPHAAQLSRHKAYTAASLAALHGLHTTTELADVLRRSKAAIGMLPLPADSVDGITPLPGGVVLRQQERLLGGLGVSGAREGQVDEGCALEAEAWLNRQFVPARGPSM